MSERDIRHVDPRARVEGDDVIVGTYSSVEELIAALHKGRAKRQHNEI